MEENEDFLQIHKETMEVLGFWREEYLPVVLMGIEGRYKTEIIREWTISAMVIHGDKVLTKWAKRFQPLTDQELAEKYGR